MKEIKHPKPAEPPDKNSISNRPRIIPDVGLCICLHNIVKLEEPYILPGDEASHTRTTFRYVVFKPCRDEIIIGRVKSNTPSGIQVTVGFFDAIFIKAADMMDGMSYDETEKIWFWKVDDMNNLFVDVGQKIALRVKSETFEDTTPTGPQLAAENKAHQGEDQHNASHPRTAEIKDPLIDINPYTIYGSIYGGSGLGLVCWWANVGFDGEQEESLDEASFAK